MSRLNSHNLEVKYFLLKFNTLPFGGPPRILLLSATTHIKTILLI